MGELRRGLVDYIDAPDPLDAPDDEISALQLGAAAEYFAECRGKVPALDETAERTGVEMIRSEGDVAKLLFDHSIYKSYSESYIRSGQWDRLLAWYDRLAAESVLDTDVEGVRDIDQFVDRLWSSHHYPYFTSGTSTGRVSLLNNSAADRERVGKISVNTFGWPKRPRRDAGYRFYSLNAPGTRSRIVDSTGAIGRTFGLPDAVRFLDDEPRAPSQSARVADMRRLKETGTVTPQAIDQFERTQAEKKRRLDRAQREMAEDIWTHRDQPMIISGSFARHWSVIQFARELGMGDNQLHPDSFVYLGGGAKGVSLPDDFRQNVYGFYGDVNLCFGYGMTESDTSVPRCEAGRYHRPPWIMWLVLDEAGEKLAEPVAGVSRGRLGLLCFGFEGRWGGILSGDFVELHQGPTCACGRPGPSIADTIAR